MIVALVDFKGGRFLWIRRCLEAPSQRQLAFIGLDEEALSNIDFSTWEIRVYTKWPLNKYTLYVGQVMLATIARAETRKTIPQD